MSSSLSLPSASAGGDVSLSLKGDAPSIEGEVEAPIEQVQVESSPSIGFGSLGGIDIGADVSLPEVSVSAGAEVPSAQIEEQIKLPSAEVQVESAPTIDLKLGAEEVIEEPSAEIQVESTPEISFGGLGGGISFNGDANAEVSLLKLLDYRVFVLTW